MTKLQEYLYQYITEEQYPNFTSDETYLLAQRHWRDAEERLTACMTKKQRRLFERFMEQENYIINLQLRHVFRETLTIAHDILNISL